MKPKTLPGLALCLAPVPCPVSQNPHAAPGWQNRLEGKRVVKQIITLGTQSLGDSGVLLTLGPAASENPVSHVVLKPQVWRQKAGPQPPYLRKGTGRERVITGAQQARPGEGVGGLGVGGFVLRFCFLLWLLFSFLSLGFAVVNSPALGKTWRRYPPVHTCTACAPAPGTASTASAGLFPRPAWLASHFSRVCYPRVASTSLRP